MAELIKYKQLVENGAIFAQAIASDYIELTNDRKVQFIVESGVGTAADTTVTVKAKLGASGTAVAIPFKKKIGQVTYTNIEKTGDTLSIGGTTGECGFAVYEVSNDALKGEYDRVNINLTAVASSTVPGSIVAVLVGSRYSE